ncbi:MAG TPA: glycosyltransferase, partial [Chthoniobacterales bacterium]|nr:glycosyltransferase [Chthoniobacterales bacterium]
MNVSSRAPDLSVILPTDTYETIQPVLEKLRQQTVAHRIEVILVAPSAEAVAKASAHEADFAALRIVESATLSPLAVPRAAGMRAAAAPLIFVGETHSYLHPDAAEKLMDAAASGPWAVVTPGFENANPATVLSWASFLGAYGRWSADLPAGEIPESPLYDSLYRRDVLLALGERLVSTLSHGDDLRREMQARGHRICFEPAARIEHLNIDKPAAWFHEHFLIGLTIGWRRARQWPWWRRLVYI